MIKKGGMDVIDNKRDGGLFGLRFLKVDVVEKIEFSWRGISGWIMNELKGIVCKLLKNIEGLCLLD